MNTTLPYQLTTGDISLLFIITFFSGWFLCRTIRWGYSRYCTTRNNIAQLYNNIQYLANCARTIEEKLNKYNASYTNSKNKFGNMFSFFSKGFIFGTITTILNNMKVSSDKIESIKKMCDQYLSNNLHEPIQEKGTHLYKPSMYTNDLPITGNSPWLKKMLDEEEPIEYCDCPNPELKQSTKSKSKFEFINDDYICDHELEESDSEIDDSDNETDDYADNIKTLRSVIKKVKSEPEKKNKCVDI